MFPPHLNSATTLPCETYRGLKWPQGLKWPYTKVIKETYRQIDTNGIKKTTVLALKF